MFKLSIVNKYSHLYPDLTYNINMTGVRTHFFLRHVFIMAYSFLISLMIELQAKVKGN